MDREKDKQLMTHEVDPISKQAYKAILAGYHGNRDFSEWITNIMVAVTTKLGGIDELISGRPGSWESTAIREWMQSAGVDVPDVQEATADWIGRADE